MPELIVTCRELRYAGKPYLKGSRFHATDKHAKILKAVKKAADAPAQPTGPLRMADVPPPAPVEAPAAEAPTEEPAAEIEPVQRYYRTRRLKAED